MAESVREYEKLKREKAQMFTAQKIFDAALNMKAWVYDPEQKQWYTPEEFLEYQRFYNDHPLFVRVQLKNPLEGVEAGFKKINIIQSKLQSFYEKVIAYYANK